MKTILFGMVMMLSLPAMAQQAPAAALTGLQWRSIGPASTGGRIADFAVAEAPGQPEVMYVGTASGGVFKSRNAGVSWTPIFDHAGAPAHPAMMSIGAVAVAPSNPNIVWVGTGEVDNRQSSSWGNGIYRSLDGGATWQYMGLEATRHIAKIIIDPANPNIVYVAALGHLWGSNPERGVYKTTDGGATWNKVLFHDDNTGATDLQMSPANSNLLFAALYQRQRRGWGFNGGGAGSGIYRSSDGGATWTHLTTDLPSSPLGRIGLALSPGDPSLVYAIIEADPAATPEKDRRGGVYVSHDQGQSWEHLSSLDPRPMYYSRIYVDPRDARRVYIMGSERGFYISDDGGRAFRDVFSQVHGEDHALWIDPRDSNHLLIGGDGGVSISLDRGLTWSFRNNMPIGQFYNISTSSGSPYVICGGLQDNGNWCLPSATRLTLGIANGDTFNVGGGDGMQAVFTGDNHTLLVSLQNGATSRLDLADFSRQSIGPVPPPLPPLPGAPPLYRWYWTAPLLVGPGHPDTIYTAANVLFRSLDQGRSWAVISPDLTAHVDRAKLEMMGAPIPEKALSKNDGQDNFSAITAVGVSALDPKLIFTGADDGTVERSRGAGGTAAADWTNLSSHFPGLPPLTNVSSIEPSRFAAGRVYATFDGHFNDDYRPYVYISDDYGDTWRPIIGGLPQTSVHRLRESLRNPDFLVLGTEQGVYASWDRGDHWTALGGNLPPVPVYDLGFQAATGDLVLGTHGRSIWILDDAKALSAFGAVATANVLRLLPVAPTPLRRLDTPQAWYGAGEFFGPNPPTGALIRFYAGTVTEKESAQVRVTSGATVVRELSLPVHAGLNQVVWDLRYSPPPASGGGRGGFRRVSQGPLVAPGGYSVQISLPGQPLQSATVQVTGPAVPAAHTEAVMRAYRLQLALEPAQKSVAELERQLTAMRQVLAAARQKDPTAMAAVERAAGRQATVARDLGRAAAQIAAVERAMDSYAGAPTAAQLQQLQWAEQAAQTATAALNQLIRAGMDPAYAAIRGLRFVPPALVPPIR
ncbi:MAG: WD40/YVTN/BNR-like repeat-containing protein [Terriglobales bacterium]